MKAALNFNFSPRIKSILSILLSSTVLLSNATSYSANKHELNKTEWTFDYPTNRKVVKDRTKTEAFGVYDEEYCATCERSGFRKLGNTGDLRGLIHNVVLTGKVDPNSGQIVDDRELITDRTTTQMNAVGAVVSYDGNGRPTTDWEGAKGLLGTGFMINDCLMVTAQHAVYSTQADENSRNRKIEFHVGGTNDRGRPFSDKAYGHVVYAGESGLSIKKNDWVVVKLNKNLGKKVGKIEPLPMKLSTAKSLDVMTPGFSYDKFAKDKSELWGDRKGKVLRQTPAELWSINNSTIPFNSGGPLVAKGPDGKLYAIGIVVRGDLPAAGEDPLNVRLKTNDPDQKTNYAIPFQNIWEKTTLQKVIEDNKCEADSDEGPSNFF